MPFQPINFSGIAPLGLSGVRDLAQTLAAGYKAGRMPYEIEQKEKNARIMNSIAQLNLNNMPSQLKQQARGSYLSNEKNQLSIDSIRAAMDKNRQLSALAGDKNSPYQRQATEALLGLKQQPQANIGVFGQAIKDSQSIAAQYGKDSNEYKQSQQNIARMASGSGGTTVYDPKTGNPMVQIGGSGGSSSRGQNPLYSSGDEIVSPLTKSNITNVQSQLLSSGLLEKFISKGIGLSKFQSPITNVSEKVHGFTNKYLGTDFRDPSEKQYAISSLKTGIEPLIKDLGLKATDKTLEEVTDIVMPKSGESENGYRERIKRQLSDYIEVHKSKEDALTGGIRVRNQDNNNGSGFTMMTSPSGKKVRIPNDQVENALKSGGQRA